jgi:RND superfamily putative drug exporter
VIVSGSTVAVGLLSMLVLPLPFIRSIGIGGMLIPTVSVITAITLLPALLAVLGARVNSLRLLPKRLVDRGHPEDGLWGRWAEFVMRRPVPVAAAGLAIVAALVYCGVHLNPSEAQAKDFPGSGDAIQGRAALADAKITPGVFKPFVVLVENGGDPKAIAAKVRSVPGVSGATAPPGWRKGNASLVEAFPSADGAATETRGTIKDVRSALKGSGATLGGLAGEERDFVAAVYSNFPYVLGFVVLLTFILLARAFRSLILPLKAVILNLISLMAAYGIIVFIFQWGHGAHAIWNVHATQSIIPWIPLMIFAFLYGLSMDYEVFMLSRMREAYDETGDTAHAISLGLARTGKLVTSAALVLMFAFFVLSSSPGVDIKQFGIGLAAGIIFDATVIRTLLVPSLMRLFGRWNWWLPPGGEGPLHPGRACARRGRRRVGLAERGQRRRRPCEGLASGKLAGCRRRSRSSQRAARAVRAAWARRSAASAGAWWRAPSAATTRALRPTSVSAIARWKRPASECGQGSSGRTISRPRSESVQRGLLAQALHTCGRAR